jgi:hypothetical protein
MFAGKTPRCDCGYLVEARREEEQVAEIRRHAWEAHGLAFSNDEALAVLLRSELESSEESPLHAGKENGE